MTAPGIAPCSVALALCACLVVAGSAAAAPADNTPPAAQRNATDQDTQPLLLKVVQQIVSGRTVAPLDDNALATWEEVRKKAQEPTPAFMRALRDFITQSQTRAAAERSAGREMVAFDLQAFADMAHELLQRDAARLPASDGQAGQEQTAPAADVASAAPSAAPAPPVEPAAPPIKPPVGNAGPTFAAPAAAAAAAASPSVAPPPLEPAAAPVRLPVAAASPLPSAAPPSPVEPAARSVKLPAGDAAPTSAPPPPQQSPAKEQMASTLASRGDAMLAVKDISAARKLYEQAANLGSAAAATDLAKTYDPDYIGKLGVIGIRPDLVLAASWYDRAATLGDRQAAQRMHELDAMLGTPAPARATP